MDTLTDRVALVTGASRGIGPVIARALAAAGARVVAVARGAEGLRETVSSIEVAGGRAIAIEADLGDVGSLARLVDRAESQAGPIDVLVNNAGVEFYRRWTELQAHELAAVVTVNLHAPMELARLLVPKMLERGRGHVVSIASLAGKKGVLYNGPYSATKAGLLLWTDALRQELAGTGVSASAIAPGYIREAGMFHGDGVSPPRLLGTSSPQDVADAVVRAIVEDRQEIIVNPGPMRPLLALGQLSPALANRVVAWIGVNAMNERRLR